MYFTGAGGIALAGVSYFVSRHAQQKKRQAIQIENAVTTTPSNLLEQFHKANDRPTFTRYVALEGALGITQPCTYQDKLSSFEAAYFATTLKDKLYSCRFVQEQRKPPSRANTGTTAEEEATRDRRRMRNDTPDRPRGKVECDLKWDTHIRQSKWGKGALHLETMDTHATPSAPPLDSTRAAKGVTKPSTSTGSTARIILSDVTEQDMNASARLMKQEFYPSHEPSVLVSQQNQHQLLVVSAAGNNIQLDELQPITMGTEEKVVAVPVGDRLHCIGHATVDKKTGLLQIQRSSDTTTSADYPYVLSRKSKHEVGHGLRELAASYDNASTILGVSAGGLLAVSVGLGIHGMRGGK